MLLAVEDVSLGSLGVTLFDKNLFHQILHVFNRRHTTVFIDNLENAADLSGNLGGLVHVGALYRSHRLLNGFGYLILLKGDQATVPLTNEFQHLYTLPS